MDFFELLILALIALPAIFRWLGEQAKKGQPPGEAAPATRDDPRYEGESDFERALREIGIALGGEEPEPIAPPDFTPAGRPAQKGSEGFSREEAFEGRSQEFRSRAESVPFRRLKLARIDAPEVEEVTATRSSGPSTTRTLLLSASNARQAFLLSEVLGKPLAFRDPPGDQPAG